MAGRLTKNLLGRIFEKDSTHMEEPKMLCEWEDNIRIDLREIRVYVKS